MPDAPSVLMQPQWQPPTGADWSKFLKRLGISLSCSGSSSGIITEFDKICVLVSYISTNPYVHSKMPKYRVYVIDDLNSGNTCQSLKPLICWDIAKVGRHAFAMLGSKLFMFGGRVNCNGLLNWGNDMSYYDMEKELISTQTPQKTKTLTKEDLVNGPNMMGTKAHPFAAVIGDSKICVFGSILYSEGKYASSANFELLSTTTTNGHFNLNWKKLPDPKLADNCNNMPVHVQVQSYCVHGSCLIIKIRGHQVYGINLDHQDPKWVTLDQSEREGFPLKGMFAMVDDMLCTGFSIVEREDQYPAAIQFKVPSNRKPDLLISTNHAKCFDDRCNSFCLAQTAFDTDDGTPYLLLDIVKFHPALLSKFRNVVEWPEIETNKSFTFQLPSFSQSLNTIACLPIKNASRKNESVAAEVDQGKRKKKKRKNQGNMEKKKWKMTTMKKKKKKRKMTFRIVED